MRPLLTLPSPLERLGNGVGDAPLGSGGKVGGAIPVVTVCGTVSSFFHVTTVPFVTSMVAGVKAKPLIVIAFGGPAGLAHAKMAIAPRRLAPSTRMTRRITTSEMCDSIGVRATRPQG